MFAVAVSEVVALAWGWWCGSDVVAGGPAFVRSQAKENRGFYSREVLMVPDMAAGGAGVFVMDLGELC